MKSTRIPPLLLQFCLYFVYAMARDNTDACVLLKDCPAARNLSKVEIESSICGYEDKRYAKIWCTVSCVTPESEKGVCTPEVDCCPNKPTRLNHITPSSVEPPKPTPTAVSNNQQCGVATDQYKVVGGSIAEIGEHPWLALLQYFNRGKASFLCGGTMISNRYVLTAAHCTEDRDGLTNVVLGEHNTSSARDCIGNSCAPTPKTIRIEKVIKHPGWENGDRQFYDDISLLRLTEAVEFSNMIQPICLPPPNYKPTNSTEMTVAGWGRSKDRNPSDVKRVATLFLQNSAACLNTINIPLIERQLCVGGKEADSCRGDSGGPLMASNEDEFGITTWYLVGVVSLGYDSPCGTIGRPGVYTAVSSYLEWIQENMN